MKKITKKHIFVIFFAFLLIMGILPKFIRFVESKQTANETYTAYYEQISFDTKLPDIELNGELKPYYFAQIFPKIDGTLKNRYVNIGDTVKKGQLLATIEAPLIDADKKTAEADLILYQKALTEATYKLNFTKETYERYKSSSVGGAISAQDLSLKENDFKVAQMEYKIAVQNLERAKSLLKRATELQNYEYIKAPFDGVITKYNADIGANIVSGGSSTSDAMFEISQNNKLRLRIDVPQSYLDRIKQNQEIKFYTLENPNEIYSGKITQISKSLDKVSRTMKIEICVDNSAEKLYPNLYVKAVIPANKNKKMLLVKNELIINNSKGSQVLTVDKDDKLHFVPVVIGKDFGDVVEITQGLNGSEKLVTNISDSLVEGQKVVAKHSTDLK